MKSLRFILFILVALLLVNIVSAANIVDVTPNAPTDNDALTCNIANVNGNDRANYQYFWYVNGAQDRTVGNTWTYPASRTRVDQTITCVVYTPNSFLVGMDTVTISRVTPPDDGNPQPGENHAPTVSITNPQTNTLFNMNEIISFTSNAYDSDNDQLTYSWNFGDNVISQVRNPTHTYNRQGTFTITLTVSDGQATASDSINLRIVTGGSQGTPNQNPIAILSANPIVINAGETVSFNASQSYDPDGNITMYGWDFGDGPRTDFTINPLITHTYQTAGTYTANLTVYDNRLAENSAALLIFVRTAPEVNLAPITNAGSDITAEIDEEITFDASQSYDPDGNITDYSWDFGDETTGTGTNPTHSYSTEGTYTVTLTTTDDLGLTNIDTLIVTVTPILGENPIAIISINSTQIYLGHQINFDASQSYDPDGNITMYGWDFGDGNTSAGIDVDHIFTTEGLYTVTLTVTDDTGLTGNATVLINATKFYRESNPDKERINPFMRDMELRDFRIGRVMPINYKSTYNKGETVLLLVKLNNEGNYNEKLDLKLIVPEFNYITLNRNIFMDVSQVKWVMINMQIPYDATPGIHIARLQLIPNFGTTTDSTNWEFIVS